MGEQLSVQVRDCQIRTKPSFLGAVIATVHYGDRLSSVQTKDSWLEVSFGGSKQGWIHVSALTDKEITLHPSAQQVNQSASSDELALAGKGFNKQVEEQFRRQNSQINFTWVDKIETYRDSQEEIEKFLKAGELKPAGGAA
ncbi:MAG: SH3 domain-containing protein [Proteobacteria bacterium]|nr:SH3 domain-containing protein [Pseudomonadota bacterium]MBU1649698.1 SH3 domain-containing protein [Pseudomonadota bacterium]